MARSAATAVSATIPNPRPIVAANSEAEFVEMMRTGVRPGNRPFPDTMPWQDAAKLQRLQANIRQGGVISAMLMVIAVVGMTWG